MRIGYGKVGRSMPLMLDGCGTVGGDVECVAVVKDLALRHPEDTFVLVGRNSGESVEEAGLPSNIVNPWTAWRPALRERLKAAGLAGNFTIADQLSLVDIYNDLITPTFRDLDGLVIWLGQHGSSNSPLPATGNAESSMTKPHDWEAHYCAYFFHGINAWRDVDPIKREEVWLNADARNYHKMRDLRWPWRHSTLSQFEFSHKTKHYRGDGAPPEQLWSSLPCKARYIGAQLWEAYYHYAYSRIEINCLTPTAPFGSMATFRDEWAGRQHFGIFINEARPMTKKPELTRGPILQRWVFPLEPAFVHGKWSLETQLEIGRTITVAPWEDYFPFLHSVRATFTTPSSGSGWATTKPWEAFAAGTVCFFHPAYDTQNNILKDAPPPLKAFLRVNFPSELAARVKKLGEDRALWEDMVAMQRAHFSVAITRLDYMREIEERIWR